MKVYQVQRKSRKGNYSIETLFKVVRKHINCHVALYCVKFYSSGLINRLQIILECFRLRKLPVHITGDITFANLLLNKNIITFHDFEFIHRSRGLKRTMLKFLWVYLPAKRATRITVISEATKDALLKLVKLPSDKINVIYNPLTIENKATVIDGLKFQKHSFVLCIGTKENKNLESILRITQKHRINLVALGQLNMHQKDLINDQSIFQNFVDISESELVYLYRNAGLLCFCSFEEGFGLPIIEAQYLGCPVLTSNCSSMPEVGGDAALYVDPYNVDEIRFGIKELIQNTTHREKLISAGLENVKRFDAGTIARQYENLYKQIFS